MDWIYLAKDRGELWTIVTIALNPVCFLSCRRVQTDGDALAVRKECPFLRGKIELTHVYLVSKWRMLGATPPFFHAFAWRDTELS